VLTVAWPIFRSELIESYIILSGMEWMIGFGLQATGAGGL
jgi:hypothetical protein